MKRALSSILLTAATAAIVLVPGAAAQDPGPLPGVFGEVLDVRVVNLEVVVTDKNGVPVLGLAAGDFKLTIDGEEVPIDYFSEVRGSVAVERPAVEGDLPAIPDLAPGERVGTSYLLFIDEFFSIGVDRDRVLRGIVDDLALLGPEDRMAVVAYDGDKLEMLSSWSSSVPELRRVLERAMERPSRGLQRLAERRQARIDESVPLATLLGEDDVGFNTFARNRLEPQERFYVYRLAEQVDRSTAAAAATLRSFAKPPGRKVMLLLSGGWPFFPTEYLYSDFDRLIFDREGLEGDDLYRRLIDTANLLGFTLYPVDVPGLDREGIPGVEVSAASDATTVGQTFLREQELHFTLDYLAKETGGRAFINANRQRVFEGVVSDTRSYYWLGFSPGRAWDDARHEVRVEVREPGYKVRSRAGYLDTSHQREVTMAVESALLFGNSPTDGPVEVQVGEPRKAGRGKVEVPLSLLIPLDQLTFLRDQEGFVSQIELRIAVVDSRGRRAPVPVIPIGLRSAEEPAAGTVGRYETTLRLRREPHDAVVAVYDAASGRILASSLEISP